VATCMWKIPLADGRLEVTIDDQPPTRPIDRLIVMRFDEPVSPERSRTWADSLARLWGSSTEEREGRLYRSSQCTAFVSAEPGHLEVQLLYALPR
jgi:hypothetical protein